MTGHYELDVLVPRETRRHHKTPRSSPGRIEIRDMLGDLERFVSDVLTLPLVGEENAPPAQ